MKKFLTANYQWVLLGLALLIALVSAAFIIILSLGFRDGFASASNAVKSTGAPTQPETNAVAALTLLKKGADWKDGSSPLVSRPYLLKEGKLVDPMEGNQPLYPPIPNKWLVDHNLDYADINILQRDPKGKGFTVLEEFEAGTDPNDPSQLPPLCKKLTYSDAEIKKDSYTMEFLDVDENGGHKEFQLRPVQPIPNPESRNKPDRSTRSVAKGDAIPGVPFLKVVDFVEKKTSENDTEHDVSELTLENPVTKERYTLVKKNTRKDYKIQPIEVINSIVFHYQPTGAAEQLITVRKGEEFPLESLDKKHTETYKLNNISNEGILLEKGGKSFTVKQGQPTSSATTAAPQTPNS